MTVDELRRLWRALGFPEHGDWRWPSPAPTPGAVSTLIGDRRRAALIDFDIAVNLTRAVGQTMARLADWEVAALVHRVEELEAGDDGDRQPDRTGAAAWSSEVNEPFEELLIYAWRRHLAAAVARVEALGANEEDLHTTQVTVGFADIVSFTALSNEIERGPDRRPGRGLRVPLRRRRRRARAAG